MPRTALTLTPVAPAAARAPILWAGGTLRRTSLLAEILAYYAFDEGAGSTVKDLSGNGYDGTWHGTLGAQWGVGALGGGGVFDGTTNYVSLDTLPPSVVKTGGQFSAGGWVNLSASTNFGEVVTFGGTGFELRHNGVTRIPQLVWASASVAAPAAIALNTLHHEFATFDGSTGTLYLDGVAVASLSTVSSVSNAGVIPAIGGRTTPADFLGGTLDEIGIWLRCLTPTEVATLYNNGTPYRIF